MGRRSTAGFVVGALSVAFVGGRTLVACGGASVSVAPDAGLDAGPILGLDVSADAPTTGHTCAVKPGEFPDPACDIATRNCTPDPGCAIDEAACGSASTCLPMKPNAGSSTVLDFRMRRLNLLAPPSMTYDVNPTLQTAVVDTATTLNAKQCGQIGKGTFTWLLRVDLVARTLKTGSAPPSSDPFGVGSCFDTQVFGTSDLRPATVALQGTAASLQTAPIPKLNVAIFLDNAGSSAIVLPLSGVTIQSMALSPDGSCVGTFDRVGLDRACTESHADCPAWHPAAAIGGYITLEDADTIFIKELNQSLCVLLTQTAPLTKCERDATGKIAKRGDYCSSPGGAGGCQDSYWFAATFAASAAVIDPTNADPRCK